ncbi:GntR family transcriptional regulator [Tessaracoccus antarcticus]|uniref:GntR family transcriptional regulator n=1 Tax=Tessaracoccus antarcticus TaxID=2479848 RepID=A0A3M0GRN6_9ACTN|nr:GntR family transcriptional regulator [Tessaracoccus antarcticus]RMB59936.1 GntR family transcriptional regulator [Tessaracoccus antarcticus]
MDFDTSSPIWIQLVTEFSRRVATAEWAAGVRIPGVRELALQLGVNPNTVQRALTEMERDGLCRSERTAGRFVTDDGRRVSRLRRELAAGAADDYIRISRGLRMERDDATALVDERWNENDNPNHDRSRAEG